MNRAFIDTNIFVYWLNQDDAEKNKKATALIGALSADKSGVCSMQVVREFSSVASKKFVGLVGPVELDDIYDTLFAPFLSELAETPELYKQAFYLQKRYSLQFYDALIVQSAIALGCDRLYSEDLQHGQIIEGVEIIDPFCA